MPEVYLGRTDWLEDPSRGISLGGKGYGRLASGEDEGIQDPDDRGV